MALHVVASMVLVAAGLSLLPPDEAARPKVGATPQVNATLVRETRQVWSDVLGAAKPCDDAQDGVSQALSAGNPYVAYTIVQAGERLCAAAMRTIGAIDPPASSGDARAQFSDALTDCRNAYAGREMADSALLKVVDGDARPSAVTEAMDEMKLSSTDVASCVVGFVGVASRAGVSIDSLSGGPPQKAN